jgi:hypothetical protein
MQQCLLLRMHGIFRLLLIVGLLPVFAATPWVARVGAAGFEVRINFQPGNAIVPTGYLRDSGDAFAVRSGAGQGGGSYSYGWIGAASRQPQSMANQARERNREAAHGIDQRLDTLMHMQPAGAAEGVWEIVVPPGSYDVLVGVGDAQVNATPERHTIRLEGTTVITSFVGSGLDGSFTRHRRAAAIVAVNDGRLTVDAQGGNNTKINYIDIRSSAAVGSGRPTVREVRPAGGEVNVRRDEGVFANVNLFGQPGIIYDTVNSDTVRLMRMNDGARIPFSSNSSAGGDVISIQPQTVLDPNTQYVFEVTDGVKNGSGVGFSPFYTTFTTGVEGGPITDTTIAFAQTKNIATAANGSRFSSVTIGPDGRLYVATLQGEIYRYTINDDGSLGNQFMITTVRDKDEDRNDPQRAPRAIIGLAWDPAATASNLILWVSHNGRYVESNAPDWTGKIARLSGTNLQNFQNYVVNLPHSYKDHMTNSLAFGPDGRLYVSVGSNSAMGQADSTWGLYPERLLAGAILQINTKAISAPPLDAKTEEGGSYNPYAANAPVKLYATGVRNAYDLVWHSNGKLYAPTNGSAAGGNTPPIPAPEQLPATCTKRIDGKPYNGPTNKPEYGLVDVPKDQKDWLFRIEQGGYYGHPNPLRCEWVLNGGNKPGTFDEARVAQYPAGTAPDPNYRGSVYDFGLNKSPNGAIEYTSDNFKGKLEKALLVVRFSQRKDIIALKLNSNGGVEEGKERIPGLEGFNNPLDLVENRENGDLYVVEFGPPSSLTLVQPLASGVANIEALPQRIVTSDAVDGAVGSPQTLVLRNTGNATLKISDISISGADASQFQDDATTPIAIPAGETRTVRVTMDASSIGVKTATLEIRSNARNARTAKVELRGLGFGGAGGGEPSLQRIFDAYAIPVNVGDPNPADSALPPTTPLGEEVDLPFFVRADSQLPVTIEPLAAFGPTNANPVVSFGWYRASTLGNTELFSITNNPASNGQRLNPPVGVSATLVFDPGPERFGLFSSWPAFQDNGAARVVYSQDERNVWEPVVANRHKVRVYQLKEPGGAVVPNTYVVAMEEFTSSYDYQDVVVIVRNVKAPPPPTAPLAGAGNDQRVFAGAAVTLEGTGSDANEEPLTFSWRQTGGPQVALENVQSAAARFTPQQVGVYTFELTVRDPGGLTNSDTVMVTAESRGIKADAGSNQSSVKGKRVTLRGSGTTQDETTLTYSWQQSAGSPVTLEGANAATAQFEALEVGKYRFLLVVSNGYGAQATDEVEVVVAERGQGVTRIYFPVMRR